MKKILIFALLIVSFLSSCQKNREICIEFTKENAPNEFLLNEKIYSETGNLFLMKNGDQYTNTSIVSYNIEKKAPVEIIYEMTQTAGKIRDWVVTDEMMAFSTLFMQENSLYVGIYFYHFASKSLKQLKVFKVSYEDLHPLQLCADGHVMAWLEQSMEDEKTRIKTYNLATGEERLLREFDFTIEGFWFATFVLAMKDGSLYYDYRTDEKSVLRMLDLKTGKDYFELDLPKAVIINNYLRVNKENDYFVLVGKSEYGNLIYMVDRVGMCSRELEAFAQTKMVNENQICTSGQEILYSVESYVPGGQSEYYACCYNLNNYSKNLMMGAYAVFRSEHYLGYLINSEKEKDKVELRLNYQEKVVANAKK